MEPGATCGRTFVCSRKSTDGRIFVRCSPPHRTRLELQTDGYSGVVMNLRNVLIVTVTLAAGTAFAADGNFDKTYSLTGPASVSVSTGSGYVHVYPWPGIQVHIVGHVHSRPGIFGCNSDEAVRGGGAGPPGGQAG